MNVKSSFNERLTNVWRMYDERLMFICPVLTYAHFTQFVYDAVSTLTILFHDRKVSEKSNILFFEASLYLV